MANFDRKNQEEASILEDIYRHNYEEDVVPAVKTAKKFFQNTEKSNRAIAGLVVLVACFTLIFGAVWIKYTIAGPFSSYFSQDQTITLGEDNNLLIDESIYKDTDKDGLSDYDELNVYKTSPYLEDSDSDGVNDLQEIQNGTDPNCLAGENCGLEEIVPAEISDDLLAATAQGAPPADYLRTLLLNAGMPQAALDLLSDNELQTAYQELLAEQQGQAPSASIANPEVVTALKSLSPAELRVFLNEQGVDQQLIDNVSDSELLDLVSEVLAPKE